MQISPNNSGASLIIQNNYTDAQGQVVATYIAGAADRGHRYGPSAGGVERFGQFRYHYG